MMWDIKHAEIPYSHFNMVSKSMCFSACNTHSYKFRNESGVISPVFINGDTRQSPQEIGSLIKLQ